MSMTEAPRTTTPLGRTLRARPAVEPLIFVALALLYVWLVQPTHNDWLRIPYMAVVVLIPIGSAILHRDTLRELGLRLDNFWRSAREVGLLTLAAAILVIAIGVLAGGGSAIRPGMLTSFLIYPAWGLIQQYAMQSFAYRRLRAGVESPAPAAALTALLFASLHYPNLPLVISTLVGSYAWCRLFERNPNLLTLALSHGWLAVLVRAFWPAVWLHGLRIGPTYWTWTP